MLVLTLITAGLVCLQLSVRPPLVGGDQSRCRSGFSSRSSLPAFWSGDRTQVQQYHSPELWQQRADREAPYKDKLRHEFSCSFTKLLRSSGGQLAATLTVCFFHPRLKQSAHEHWFAAACCQVINAQIWNVAFWSSLGFFVSKFTVICVFLYRQIEWKFS